MNAFIALRAIVRRDWLRAFRQKGRLVGGLLRPFMWFVLIGTGYNAVAHLPGVRSYRAFVLPGVVVMASQFGAMLTAIGTVYDREFGMLRLMLASPAGPAAVLAGRAVAATLIGAVQGLVILAFAPAVVGAGAAQIGSATAAVVACSAVSSVLGLLIAAPLRSVENFAAVINLVLFPLLFSSSALYPTEQMPDALRILATLNPVTYCVDLMRGALGFPNEFSLARSLMVLASTLVAGFALALFLFDAERRLMDHRKPLPPRKAV